MSQHDNEINESRINLKLWKKLFSYLMFHKKTLIILGIFMAATGILDAVFPVMQKYAVDNFIITGELDRLPSFAVLYIGLVLLQAVNVLIFIILAGKIEAWLSYDIRKAGFRKLQELSLSYYDNKAVGWLMPRMTSDIRKIGAIISWGFVDIVWGIMMMFFMLILMFIYNYKLALVTIAVFPVILVVSVYFQKRILTAYRKVRRMNSRITGAFNEGISGARTTKTLVREEENLAEFSSLTGKMRDSSIRAAVFSSLFQPIILLLTSIGTALAIYIGGRGVYLQQIEYGTLVMFISYTTLFFEPVIQLARVFAELQYAQAAAERTFSMIDTEPEIKDSEEVVKEYGDVFNPRRENWPEIKGNISFRNVSFHYTEKEEVLENFNLEVKAGETIALVGETGSGKSTIVNLLCRFYEPASGQILIDGVEYRQRSQLWLHENIGIVLQNPHLFSGTIRENILYGKLDASEEEMIWAARLVNADKFISKLEKGYDTEVGEGGGLLSTGQKQLISFARAVISNPRIFVLDEATSSIDTEMEKIIQDAIMRVLKGRTNFIIAHRLSTIRNADRILVIKDGRILEEGNHQELMRERGYYYNLYTNQFLEEREKQLVL
ncbi:MAG: ABC transporter ATP-binding protein [Halanaerobiaceae bacterium]|nr:ABC transporter ATP-binding protein [Halanaerobiaceae bacterium]